MRSCTQVLDAYSLTFLFYVVERSEQIYLFAFHCENVKQKEESLAVFHQPGSGSRMISPLPPNNSRVPGEVRILRGNGGSVLLQVCT